MCPQQRERLHRRVDERPIKRSWPDDGIKPWSVADVNDCDAISGNWTI